MPRSFRLVAFAVILGLAASAAGSLPASPLVSDAEAASCVRFSATRFDSPGNDNYMPQLNEEWVRIKNYCSTTKSLSGWRIHDYGKKHTYTFATGVKIGPGASITLHSGLGSNTAAHRYWQRSYGAVWNNSAPEKAYLRNAAGTLMSSRTEY